MKYSTPTNRNIWGAAMIALASGCLWPSLAQAVPITQIENQATGTYDTQTGEIRSINVLSNHVLIVLQEVAGITITPVGITKSDNSLNGGAVNSATTGAVLFYNFEIQNTGNDTTRFYIPNQAQVSALGTFQKVQYFDGKVWQDIATGYTADPLDISSKLLVRVVVQANNGNGDIIVTLGHTASSDQSQNQERVANPEDVYTVDAPDQTNGEIDGSPSNGIREAQATQSLPVGLVAETLAQVNLKIDSPLNPADNTIVFGLSLAVLNTLPPNINNVVPNDLQGLDISVNGQTRKGILIANAIPLSTKFVSAVSPNQDWVPVYYYSSSPIGVTDRADQANWSTVKPDPATAVNVKRVGFFQSTTKVTTGTEIKGFQVKVAVTDTTQTQIYNIAQVFGAQATNSNNNSSPKLVIDESGDDLPSNYNYDGTPPVKSTNQQPQVDSGIIDPGVPADDPRSPSKVGESLGTNSTTSPAGEFLKVVFKASAPPSLQNGPRDRPQALGPTNNQDDFTNKSTNLTTLTETTFDPASLSFTNTVLNTSDTAQDIKILPKVDVASDLPNGTKLTLSDPTDPTITAIFDYKDGIFSALSGNPATLIIKQLAASTSKNYIVTIDLPAGTSPLQAFPVQILAFVDSNNNNLPDAGEAQNATIDRTYTGFMKVVKESRVLNIDGQPLNNGQDDGAFSTTVKPVSLDQFIEYRITYSNISTPDPTAGKENRTISATNFTIIEDGQVAPNNWATFTNHNPNSSTKSSGNIIYSTADAVSDTTNPLVVKYENKLTDPVSPGQTGSFTFRRRLK